MVTDARRASQLTGVLLVSTAASAWGTWSLFLRPTGLPATVTAPIALAFIGLASWPLVLLDRPDPQWTRRTVLLLVAMAALDSLNVAAFFAAMDVTTVSIAVLTHYLAPILVAVAAPMVDRERVPGAVQAAVVATVGLALVLEPWNAAANALAGGALGALSAIGYSANVFIARRLTEQIGAGRTMSYHAFGSAIILLPLAFSRLPEVSAGDLGWLAAGSAGPGALAGFLFLRGLHRIGSARTAVLAFLEPLVAVLIAYAVWGDRLGPTAALGALAILAAGIAVASRERLPVTRSR